MVDISAEGWTAGGVYTTTAAKALGAAAAAQASVRTYRVSRDPQLIEGVEVMTMPDVGHSLPGERLFRRTTGRAPRSKRAPGERRLRQALSLPDHQDPVWVAERRGMDVAFPVLSVPRRRARIGMVGWVPDLQHLHFPEFFAPTDIASRDRQFRLLAERCHKLVFSSETVRREFEERFPAFGHKTRTLQFPSQFALDATNRGYVDVVELYDLPDRYFLCANQFWRHKNHELVIKALALAVERDPSITCVFTGLPSDGRDPDNTYVSELLQLIATARLNVNIRVLGLVPKPHLEALLRGTLALLQPSISEGWNTSVEDAKALGTPVIALNTSVLHEQAPHATFVENDPGDLAQVLLYPQRDEMALAEGRHLSTQTANAFGPLLLDICLEASRDAKKTV